MLLTLAGTLSLLVLIQATTPTAWMLTAPVLVTGLGLGLGTCFDTVYEVALGVGPKESGSASGSLSAVAQLANSIGAAAITTVYFHTPGGSTNAAAHSLAVVAVATLACCALVWLLPRNARPRQH